MTLGRRNTIGAIDSDEGDEKEFDERRSNLTGSRTVVVKYGLEPKIEMKKKLARQSDLI